MASIRIAFLWHHHQPDYRDPATGRPTMPWVRLHALRGYRDLAVALLESGVPMTVNLVPSLLDQLEAYARGESDPWLELVRKPAAELTPDERRAIARDFFAGPPNLVNRWPPWARLRALSDAHGLERTSELCDLQVWSLLGWLGWSAVRDHPELAALRDKGAGFTEEDKAVLLDACDEIVREVIPLYRRLGAAGRAEISASPYYHPILPLLVDARHARRSLPHLPDTVRFAWPDDARIQLRRGRKRMGEAVGREITGLWPPEGAVSPEVVELAREAGFRWLVSDEGNLERSERDPGPLDAPWDLGGGFIGFFRNRALSDAIGFRYATLEASAAVEDFLTRLRQHEGLVTVALDGENPWEAFPDAGEAFLRMLCDRLLSAPDIEPMTFSGAAAEIPPAGRVRRLHTGSWINSDLAIWIGDAADRRAWRLLAETREAVASAGDPPLALEHVLAAEGSDWFWWYGPEFSTPHAAEFDRLFRAHLGAAWRDAHLVPPSSLAVPIQRIEAAGPAVHPPWGPVYGTDGWTDWANAGWLDCAEPGGAMSPASRHLDGVAFGQGKGWVWLRLVFHRPLPAEAEGTEWAVVADSEPGIVTWRYDARGTVPTERTAVHRIDPARNGAIVGLKLPVPDGEAKRPRSVRLQVAVRRNGIDIARYPASGGLTVPLGTESWWV